MHGNMQSKINKNSRKKLSLKNIMVPVWCEELCPIVHILTKVM